MEGLPDVEDIGSNPILLLILLKGEYMRVVKPISDFIASRKSLGPLKKWIVENNLQEKPIVNGYLRMFVYKRMISRMVDNLMEDFNSQDNTAVTLLAGMLNGIIIISSSSNDQHSWDAIDALAGICKEIIEEDGDVSTQFQIMAQTASMENRDKQNDS